MSKVLFRTHLLRCIVVPTGVGRGRSVTRWLDCFLRFGHFLRRKSAYYHKNVAKVDLKYAKYWNNHKKDSKYFDILHKLAKFRQIWSHCSGTFCITETVSINQLNRFISSEDKSRTPPLLLQSRKASLKFARTYLRTNARTGFDGKMHSRILSFPLYLPIPQTNKQIKRVQMLSR